MAYAGGYPPKKGAEFLLIIPIFDNDGDVVTGATGLDSEISKDAGAFTDCANEVTELGSSGIYTLTLTATEMNADVVAVIVKTSTTDAKTTPTVIYTSSLQLSVTTSIITGVGAGPIVFTLQEMLDELGIYLSDLNQAEDEPFEFSEVQKVVALNRAQDKVLQKVKNDYPVELHLLIENNALGTSGEFNLSTLTSPVFHKTKGLMGIKLHDGKFCNVISFPEWRVLSDRGVEATSNDPISYLRGTYVYVEGYGAGDTIDIFYMREAVKMALDATGSHGNDTSCELRSELQDIIIEYAAYILFKYGRDINRAKMAFMDAQDGIKTINDSQPTSDSINYAILRSIGRTGIEGNGSFDIMKGR